MGRIEISFETVWHISNKLSNQLQSRLERDIIAGYDRMEGIMFQSGGEAVAIIIEELGQEKEALIEMKNFMLQMLKLLQKSANAFEQIDTGYQAALKNYGQEK